MRRLGAALCAVLLWMLLSPALSQVPSCGRSLQSLVDAAAPGATVTVPACLYRERVVITKPLTLAGQPGAEIRGSDVWATGWTHTGDYWTHPGVPAFPAQDAPCVPGTSRCKWPEQVFLDGAPLVHVAHQPTSGQFAVEGARRLVLADDPTDRIVEVTTRTRWIAIKSNNVTITGFRMRHAANPPQSGAIDSDGYSSITIDGNVLSDAAGAVVALHRGSALKITRNDISLGGQLGIGLTTAIDSLVQNNHIHDNNTQAFEPGWEAGGLKAATGPARLVIDSNEVDHNGGPGLWCDGLCANIVYSNNRIHDNSNGGISQEISHGAKIFGNAVWNNGFAFGEWGFGAGILIQNSDSCEVHNNTVAWNMSGITVIEQHRTDDGRTYPVFNTFIHDNVVVSSRKYALAWLSDSSATTLFDPTQNNRGAANLFGDGGGGAPTMRFAWQGGRIDSLAAFNATPGGGGNSRHLSLAEQMAALQAASIPVSGW